ncbi:MAG: CBS domain-containing protein [Xanthomonadales bacterium]|nr:CBS domain-containing protein [Xanthomonadales bacterium]NIX12799.1 CBS domain-containing protein [Xanthomonadales bacterium]
MNEKNSIIRVRDVMQTEVDVADGMQTVAEALKAMKHPDARTIIVDKRDEDDEYGVVMFKDMAKKVLARDLSPKRVNLYEIMSKPVLSVHPDMDIRYCTRLFHRFGLSRAPVVDDGRIVGLVSYTEIVVNGLIKDLLEE